MKKIVYGCLVVLVAVLFNACNKKDDVKQNSNISSEAVKSSSVENSNSYLLKPELKIQIMGTLKMLETDLDTYDEKVHKFPALLLANPISITCEKNDEFCEPAEGVLSMQLVLPDDNMQNSFKQNVGKKVIIDGSLFPSDNGNHFTKFLLDVNRINVID